MHAFHAQGLRSNGAPAIQSPFAGNSSGTLLLYLFSIMSVTYSCLCATMQEDTAISVYRLFSSQEKL